MPWGTGLERRGFGEKKIEGDTASPADAGTVCHRALYQTPTYQIERHMLVVLSYRYCGNGLDAPFRCQEQIIYNSYRREPLSPPGSTLTAVPGMVKALILNRGPFIRKRND